MRENAAVFVFTLLGVLLAAGMQAFAQETLPMPPRFTVETKPETILERYPLGVITKEAAFQHHGKALLTVTLPNGLEGWVYEVGGERARIYRAPTGEEKTVKESVQGFGVRTYTLVFGENGRVIDVLYDERGRHAGLTALQVQRERGAAVGRGGGTVPDR